MRELFATLETELIDRRRFATQAGKRGEGGGYPALPLPGHVERTQTECGPPRTPDHVDPTQANALVLCLVRNECFDDIKIYCSPGTIEVVHLLQIQPELWRHSQGLSDTPSRICGDGAASVDDLVNSTCRCTNGLRQAVLADPEFPEDLCQVLARMDRVASAHGPFVSDSQ